VGLTAIALVMWRTLIRSGTSDPTVRRNVSRGVVAWFAVVAVLAGVGAFAVARLGTLFIGTAVLLPVVVGSVLAARRASLRAAVLGIPIATLVALHVGRALGAFFIVLHSDGRLPPTFAHTAGWGDIAVAILAVPVAWAAHRRAPGWAAMVLAWNTFGLVDLASAVILGVGSADSPLRFIWESPATGTIASLPWTMIPGFLVPTYVLVHLAIFAQLRSRWSAPAVVRPARV
jgi:hypothetical protein